MALVDDLPLIGRHPELRTVRAALEAAAGGQGRVLLVSGDSGIGKSRLAQATLEEAATAGWRTAHGRSFAAETGVPYSLFADALLPVLDTLSDAVRTIITRGAEQELLQIFPTLAHKTGRKQDALADAPDLKNRLLWNFTEVIRALARQKPLLIVLEDLQWADASSLELLHFIARQVANERVLFLCSFNEALRNENPALVTTTRSLDALDRTQHVRLAPLTLAETGEIAARAFGISVARASDFVALLYGWTRGNPFFIKEVLRTLIESGRGWEVESLELPTSIREAVMQRARRLSPEAFTLAETLAVIGRQAPFEILQSVTGASAEALLAQLQELLTHDIISERAYRTSIAYDFAHPLSREAFLFELGETRRAALHTRTAQKLESHYGEKAADNADELAFHYGRAIGFDDRAVKYSRIAGHRAFLTFANREAIAYLQSALRRMHEDDPARTEVMEQLARAYQRMGGYDDAQALWKDVCAAAARSHDHARVAGIQRRMGVANFWSGQMEQALVHYEAALEAALRANDDAQQVHVRIARAMALQELGRLEEALPDARSALELAEQLGDTPLMGRAHRALLLLYVWNGPPDLAREHGREAIRLLGESTDRSLVFSTHWAIGVLEGLNGNSAGLLHHLARAEAIAEEVRSPVLRLWTDELAIEYGYGAGDWNGAIERGEHAITLARALNQRMLLPRLLVWTALMRLARNEIDVARRYIDEAWKLSGAEQPQHRNVHVVVPAHTGLASYHLAVGDYDEAIRVGQRGLEIAESSGYAVWAVHRLLPVIAEAHLYKHDVPAAVRVGARLRRESLRLNHKLGLAWADACDALLTWLGGDPRAGATLLSTAAEALEAIPFVPDAARVRRQLAGRLAEIGDREGALTELRRVHSMLTDLGAERELIKTREMFRELGARPPAKDQRGGAEALTDRELDIVRLVLAGKSNKAIGKALEISDRTVSTHLSNIFKKLGMSSRVDLVAQRADLGVLIAR